MNRHQEYHVTVLGDPFQWRGFCTAIGIKPLWIELNNFETQLMCASPTDPTLAIAAAGWTILRVKHEVETSLLDVTSMSDVVPRYLPEHIADALYYECHVKLNGVFCHHLEGSSRDLFRRDRWYVTRRQRTPFDPTEFVDSITSRARLLQHPSLVDSFEYEAAIRDSNPSLDAEWIYVA